MGIWVLAAIGSGLSQGFWSLLVARMLVGAGEPSCRPTHFFTSCFIPLHHRNVLHATSPFRLCDTVLSLVVLLSLLMALTQIALDEHALGSVPFRYVMMENYNDVERYLQSGSSGILLPA